MPETGVSPLYGTGKPIPPDMARAIRLVILDVDGVLTDGGVYLGALPGGEAMEFKRFDIQDGLGIKLLEWAGIEVAIVSGRVSEATAVRAREKGLRTLWITCGYILEEPLRRLCPHLDAANVDLKGMSEDFYRTYCRARLAPVLAALRVLREEGVWIEVTNLVIPKANDSDACLRDLSRWVRKELGPDTPVHFSRFHPDYKLNDRSPTPIATLTRAREIAKEEGLRYVYVGNARIPDGQTTFCPCCGIRLVERQGYEIVSFRLRDGACPECGTVIPGIWK